MRNTKLKIMAVIMAGCLSLTMAGCSSKKNSDASASAVSSESTEAKASHNWNFTVYGTSTDEEHNGYTGSADEGNLTIYSTEGKGKIVPASCQDGLSFYYTVMDPETENFSLEADITVDSWTLSGGQEGVGLMVSDTIGENGDTSVVWNNSIQNVVSRMIYNWNGTEVTSNEEDAKITMKLGVGVNARLGVTADDMTYYENNGEFLHEDGSTSPLPQNFSANQYPLETGCAKLGTGTYNIVGNCTNEPEGTVENPITKFHLSIQRNNTGYILTYADQEGNVIGKKLIYDLERDALTQIDPDHIYVGFIAARNATMSVSNIHLTTIAPKEDDKPEEREITSVEPVYTIESASTANAADYTLVYYGNTDGTITIQNSNGETIAEHEKVTAGVKSNFETKLNPGDNIFTVTVTPDKDYRPDQYTELSDYEPVTLTQTVSYRMFEGSDIYVSSKATPAGDGSKDNPADIYTAVSYASPGQRILLAGGTYHLTSPILIARGINGTEEKMICMTAENSSERPVFDFGGSCSGMSVAGDYWDLSNFDVTNSQDSTVGISISGNYNKLSMVRAYQNGNSGIQIARLYQSDEREAWPSYNTVTNCTSYLNADAGYENADGFAAKITAGEGNVFDGCIAAYNADDGWDLYAKVETGQIGKVTIKNSVAFMNGYLLDEEGNLVKAGNGNGFKMGGESLSGHHTLSDSLSFANKANGIDSNDCPDIEITDSISFDNEGSNISLHSSMAKNTDFIVQRIISFKLSSDKEDRLEPLGTQDPDKIYGESNYYTYSEMDSYNTPGEGKTAEHVSEDWFENLDTAAVVKQAEKEIKDGTFGLVSNGSSVGIERDADGTILTNGYMELTENAD